MLMHVTLLRAGACIVWKAIATDHGDLRCYTVTLQLRTCMCTPYPCHILVHTCGSAPPCAGTLPETQRPLSSGLDAVIVLSLDDEALVLKRALGRRLDPQVCRQQHPARQAWAESCQSRTGLVTPPIHHERVEP
jgi:hypothetical protein